MNAFKLPGPIIIETERLILRPFRPEDWLEVHKYASDPEISRFQGWGPNSTKDTREFVAKCIDETKDISQQIYYFSIAGKVDDRHIGGCMFSRNQAQTDGATIGYTICRSEWSKGYATEVAGAILSFGFDRLYLARIDANCDSDNVGSWRVMEKIGMHRDKVVVNAKYLKGSWRTWYEYSLTWSDWNKRRESQSHETG